MPAAVQVKPLKRKHSQLETRPAKRARSASASSASDEEDGDPAELILTLEQKILSSRKHYNSITTLLEAAEDGPSDGSMLALVALCRIFVRLLVAGHLKRSKTTSEKDLTVVHWLRERLVQYHAILLGLLEVEEQASAGLDLAMRLLKVEGQQPLNDSGDYSFPKTFLAEIVGQICGPQSWEASRSAFAEEYANTFDDVRLHTFMALRDLLKDTDGDSGTMPAFDAAFDLLFQIDYEPIDEHEREYLIEAPKKKGHPVLSVSQHRKHAQQAWLGLLRLGLDKAQRKRVLEIMSRTIAPWFANPELLMDFLLDCYNEGGATTLLALSGVFYLIQERNLDYPDFYKKLYSLLDADILHSKHRSRFFRLLDTFLASSHLPAALVASFIKRLSRLALNAPPAAIVTIVPWMYNLFKKHPVTTFMMHCVPRTAEEKERYAEEGFPDPFVADEPDPMDTHAIDSCLWEIVQLQSHYHPNVATIAKIISEQFTKDFYNLEDFLDHSYASLLDAEIVKNVKKAPVVEFQIPKTIFLPRDDGVEDGLLVKLWDFS